MGRLLICFCASPRMGSCQSQVCTCLLADRCTTRAEQQKPSNQTHCVQRPISKSNARELRCYFTRSLTLLCRFKICGTPQTADRHAALPCLEGAQANSSNRHNSNPAVASVCCTGALSKLRVYCHRMCCTRRTHCNEITIQHTIKAHCHLSRYRLSSANISHH
jgi:hypothetical protein